MKTTFSIAGLTLAVLSGAAAAQAAPRNRASGTTEPIEHGRSELSASARNMLESPQSFFSRENLSVAAGGGFIDFTDTGTDLLTSPGGSWTVRGIFGADQALSLEGGYLGAAIPVTALNGDTGSVISNGLEALGRVGYPLRGNRYFFLPYLTAGLGFNIFNAASLGDATGVDGSDLVFTIPIGFGLGAGYDRFTFDVRYMYRPSWGASMFDDAIGPGTDRGDNTVSFTAMVGYRL
jgi:hypothetical protein